MTAKISVSILMLWIFFKISTVSFCQPFLISDEAIAELKLTFVATDSPIVVFKSKKDNCSSVYKSLEGLITQNTIFILEDLDTNDLDSSSKTISASKLKCLISIFKNITVHDGVFIIYGSYIHYFVPLIDKSLTLKTNILYQSLINEAIKPFDKKSIKTNSMNIIEAYLHNQIYGIKYKNNIEKTYNAMFFKNEKDLITVKLNDKVNEIHLDTSFYLLNSKLDSVFIINTKGISKNKLVNKDDIYYFNTYSSTSKNKIFLTDIDNNKMNCSYLKYKDYKFFEYDKMSYQIENYSTNSFLERATIDNKIFIVSGKFNNFLEVNKKYTPLPVSFENNFNGLQIEYHFEVLDVACFSKKIHILIWLRTWNKMIYLTKDILNNVTTKAYIVNIDTKNYYNFKGSIDPENKMFQIVCLPKKGNDDFGNVLFHTFSLK